MSCLTKAFQKLVLYDLKSVPNVLGNVGLYMYKLNVHKKITSIS